jgi:hypothetical protein
MSADPSSSRSAELPGRCYYVKLAAPEPEILRVIGEESEKNGTSTLTSRQIDQIIKMARGQKKKLSRLCLPQAISQCDHCVADALPFAQIEALCIRKTDIGEKPASFANKLHV